MTSITVSNLGKCYRTNKAPSPLQQLAAKFTKKGKDALRPARELWALKDVSFSLERGTILGVIGPNGAGKTTLLKVLARVTPPTEGRVVGHGTVAPLLELGAGLQPEMTARENISMYMAWNGLSRADIEQRTGDIVAFAEIEEFIDTPLKRFSNGMYVRLAFSMAINMQPDVLLADEILAVGDLTFQERCLQRVEEAGAAGMTVFFVSHDMAAIQRLCTRVILAQRRPPGARRRSGNGREPLRAVGLDDGGRRRQARQEGQPRQRAWRDPVGAAAVVRRP